MLNFNFSLTFNSGLDVWAHQTRNHIVLANIRMIRHEFSVQHPELKNFYPKELFCKRRRQILRKAAQLELVREFKTGFQFCSEEKTLRKLLKRKTISISQQILIYSAASNYTLRPEPRSTLKRKPKEIKFNKQTFLDLSFAISILSFNDHTGQQKMADRLGLTRQTVCGKTKKNRFLKSQQNWVRVQHLARNENLSSEKVRATLKQLSGGYKVGPDGWLYRQVTNSYRQRNIIFQQSDHKTFEFSNSKLNRSLAAETSRAGRGPEAPTNTLPISKRISWVRTKSRTERYAKGVQDQRTSKLKFKDSLSIQNHIFRERHYTTQIQYGTKPIDIEYSYLQIQNPYGKLKRELNLLGLQGILDLHNLNLRIYRGTLRQTASREISKHTKGLAAPEGSKTKRISKWFFRTKTNFEKNDPIHSLFTG